MIADEPDDSVSETRTQVHSHNDGTQRRAISMPVKPVTTTVKMIEPFAKRIISRMPAERYHIIDRTKRESCEPPCSSSVRQYLRGICCDDFITTAVLGEV